MPNRASKFIQRVLNQLQGLASHVSPLLIFALCIVLTGIASVFTFRLIQNDEQNRFDRSVIRVVEAAKARLQIYENVLLATQSLFQTRDDISRKEFHDFLQGFQLQERYPGIQGVGYAVRLSPQDLRAHTARIRRNGFSDYHVWPEGRRSQYFSIVYLEPFNWRNQRAFGYDMFTEPTRRRAMETARDTGKPAVSDKVILVQETQYGRQVGFLLYVPIYKKGQPISTVEERRQALRGFIYAPFRAGDLFENVSNDVQRRLPNVRVQIYDRTNQNPENLLFDSGVAWKHRARFHSTEVTIPVANRTWSMRLSSTPQFEIRSARLLPWFIMGLGSVASVLIFIVLHFARRVNASLRLDLELQEKSAKEVLKAQKAAEEANQAKSGFLANMSHEIRTPLGVILGFADLALDVPALPDDVRNYLRAIKRNGHQLMTLVGEVLDLSKIEANRMEVETLKFSLPNVLEEIISSLELRAREKGIDLIYDGTSPIPECVKTDPTKFRQILINLIGNAIKFTDKGVVKVCPKMLSEPIMGSPIELEILIEDTGIGIRPEQQKGLFQAFSQADPSMTRRFGGTGLGLILSRKLANALKGDVQLVHSSPERGSLFSFRLPAGPFEGYWEPRSDVDPENRGTKLADGRALVGTKVLLVEDSPDNQLLVSLLLNSEGADIDIASDGLEALEKTNAKNYDVVLMDIQMPNMDGHAATRKLRQGGFQKPIIGLTAHAFKEERERALKGGFNAYLTKPVARASLVQEILQVTHH